jgi:hypothetical protein
MDDNRGYRFLLDLTPLAVHCPMLAHAPRDIFARIERGIRRDFAPVRGNCDVGRLYELDGYKIGARVLVGKVVTVANPERGCWFLQIDYNAGSMISIHHESEHILSITQVR